jgi:hypothetical protein
MCISANVEAILMQIPEEHHRPPPQPQPFLERVMSPALFTSRPFMGGHERVLSKDKTRVMRSDRAGPYQRRLFGSRFTNAALGFLVPASLHPRASAPWEPRLASLPSMPPSEDTRRQWVRNSNINVYGADVRCCGRCKGCSELPTSRSRLGSLFVPFVRPSVNVRQVCDAHCCCGCSMRGETVGAACYHRISRPRGTG